jgi:hypothetical protein
MYLEFTQIDPADPDRPFGFGVKVLGDAQYQGEAWAWRGVWKKDPHMLVVCPVLSDDSDPHAGGLPSAV